MPEQPRIPAWAQQPNTTPPPAPRKPHRGLKITGGILGAIIAISVISAIASGGDKKDDGTTAAAPATTTTSSAPTASHKPATKPAPKATHKPKPAARTVLTESGNGIKTTARFHVSGDWDLHYTYNCAAFGMSGNFVVTPTGGDFPIPVVNALGKSGADVTHQHDGGTYYLDINSECSWTVRVVDIP